MGGGNLWWAGDCCHGNNHINTSVTVLSQRLHPTNMTISLPGVLTPNNYLNEVKWSLKITRKWVENEKLWVTRVTRSISVCSLIVLFSIFINSILGDGDGWWLVVGSMLATTVTGLDSWPRQAFHLDWFCVLCLSWLDLLIHHWQGEVRRNKREGGRGYRNFVTHI